MNAETEIHVRTLQRFAPAPDAIYPIDIAAHLARIPRHVILVCCKNGLISPYIDPEYGGFFFDAAAIRTLQRIEYLRTDCGINFAGIQIILEVLQEVERLRARDPVDTF
jgi:DNA-binding transcriptional MerR regulator